MTAPALSSTRRSLNNSLAPSASISKFENSCGASARSKKYQPVRRKHTTRTRLKSVPHDLEPIDSLMIQYGQFECGPRSQPIRPIVPRCMTALPENLTEFLESLLPSGY